MLITVTTLLLCILGAFTSRDQGAASSCNGSPEFCDLRLDQFTLPGSHSAGSGFAGELLGCDGEPVNNCLFRNQNLSISAQLSLGIRYLSLDVCVLPDTCVSGAYGDLGGSRLVSCQGGDGGDFAGYAYGGSLLEILTQVDDWLGANTDQVIGIHFTMLAPRASRADVFSSLTTVLEGMWGEGTSNSSDGDGYVSATEMSTYYLSNSNTWPTLKAAIDMRQRIFVFVDDELNVNNDVRTWINPTPFSALGELFSQSCANPGIIDYGFLCNRTTSNELVIAIGYTLAVCIFTGQTNCNKLFQNATNVCYGQRQDSNRTFNVLLVDFPELGEGPNSVFEVVSALNQRNVHQFLSDRMVTTSLGPGGTTGSSSFQSTTDESTSSAHTANSTSITLYVITVLYASLFVCHLASSFLLS